MVLSDTPRRGQIGPSLRGLLYQYERYGQWVTASWPKKRGKVATPKQKLSQIAFKDMMGAMKGTAAEIQTYHRLNAHGTPMLPRDSLMAALYGNGPTINFYSGKVLKPMANRIMASTVLDALGWEPGSILYRSAELWLPLPPGEDGQVLAYDADTQAPIWVDIQSGSGVPPGIWGVRGTSRWGDTNMIGTAYEFPLPYTLKAATWYTRIASGYDFYFGVALVSASNVVTSIPLTAEHAGVGGADYQFVRHELSTPVDIPAGQRFICFVQYSMTGLGNNPSVVESWSYGANVPPLFLPGNAYLNSISLGLGDTFNVSTNENPLIGLEFL